MKMLKYALGAVLTVSLAVPAAAQNFPDVPDNHWAYEALSNLRNKVLFGYPDGLYRGNRPMSRYEFAVAINQLHQMAMGKVAGLEDQIDALSSRVNRLAARKPVEAQDNSAELAALKQGLAALRRDVAGVKGLGSDVAALKRLSNEFEKELASLGVDVDAMKKDIADLDARLRAVEGAKPSINVSGELNLLSLAGHGTDGYYGLMTNQRFTGAGDGDYEETSVGLSRDLTLLHELAVSLSGTNEEGAQWSGTIVFGNMFDSLASGYSGEYDSGYNSLAGGQYSEGYTDNYVRDLSVSFGGNLLGQGFDAEVGRVSHKVGYYLFQRPDYTTEYQNEAWDNGNHYFDGGIFTFDFGGTEFGVFGGRNSDRTTSQGSELNGMSLHRALGSYSSDSPVDQSLGLTLDTEIGDAGSLKLAYIFLDSNTVNDFEGEDANRNTIFGGELNLEFGDINLFGAFSQSDLGYNTDVVIDEMNTAVHGAIRYDQENWGIGGGYREIEEYFSAPGDWGRIGPIWNPTNVKGAHGHAWFKASDTVELWAAGQQLELIDDEDYEITSLRVGLNFDLNGGSKLRLSYEDVNFEDDGDDADFAWYTIGYDKSLGENSDLLFGYTFSDHNIDGDVLKGGLVSTQIRIKF